MTATMEKGTGPLHEEYISKKELGRRLGKPVRTIEYWIWRGWLPYYKIGHSVRFKWSEVQARLGQQHHVAGTHPPGLYIQNHGV